MYPVLMNDKLAGHKYYCQLPGNFWQLPSKDDL